MPEAVNRPPLVHAEDLTLPAEEGVPGEHLPSGQVVSRLFAGDPMGDTRCPNGSIWGHLRPPTTSAPAGDNPRRRLCFNVFPDVTTNGPIRIKRQVLYRLS